MSYSKLNLTNGTVFKADHLAHIENGIEANSNDISNKQGKSDSSLTTSSKTIVGAINELNNKVASLVDGNGVAY